MNPERIYLSPPHISGQELDSIKASLDSNWIAPVGPNLDKWEQEISELTNVEGCCLLNSATAALHLSLVLLEVGPGDLVFIQSHTYAGSVYPIIYQGATPVFIDSEPDSWNMSPLLLNQAIEDCKSGKYGKKRLPKAIMPVHLYGMPANIEEIVKIAAEYNIPVIEDAAESLGSKFNGKFTGTFGKFGAYSFNGNKIITTSGGGALVSESKELIMKAKFLATQARDEAPHYQHSQIGYNYRLSNVLAGIGRGQMTVLDQRISSRRSNFKRYWDYFQEKNKEGFNVQFQEEPMGSFSNRWLTCILLEPSKNKGLSRDVIRTSLEANNIECRPLWKPMHLQPVFCKHPFVGKGVSEKLFEIGLCLPSGSNLTDENFERIFNALDACFNQF